MHLSCCQLRLKNSPRLSTDNLYEKDSTASLIQLVVPFTPMNPMLAPMVLNSFVLFTFPSNFFFRSQVPILENLTPISAIKTMGYFANPLFVTFNISRLYFSLAETIPLVFIAPRLTMRRRSNLDRVPHAVFNFY
jgi:hypothetical protein